MALLTRNSWTDWLARYDASHAHPVNRRCHLAGIPLVALSFVLGFGSALTQSGFSSQLLGGLAAAALVGGWSLQFLGHALEGSPPSFRSDVRFFVVGLVWWCRLVMPDAPWRGASAVQAPPAVATRVFNAQVALLYRLAPPSLVFSMLAAPLVCWLLVGAVSPTRLALWLTLAFALNLGRLVLVRAYPGNLAGASRAALWARRFWLGSLINGALWGLCGTMLMPRGHPDLQFALCAILGVIPGIAFTSQAAIRAVFMAFVLPFITPVAVNFLLLGGTAETVIGVAAVVFLGVLWVVSKRGERDVIDAFVQRFDNDDLMETIRQAHDRAEQVSQALAQEVTERQRTAAQLLIAKDAAEAANKVKSLFLATMSHEIRTPMNGVIGMTDLLMRTALTAQQQRYVETVQRSGEALLAIINDILDFSKIEAGKVDLENIPFDVHRLAYDVRDLFDQGATQKGLHLSCSIDPRVPQMLLGDPTRLRQILVNLVSNAIKFTSAGEVRLTVQSTSTLDRCRLQVAVQDTGIGISEESQSNLFQPFSQADGSTTRQFGGTGLGLAITRHLVELMGGSIEVDSTVGTGTRFHFAIDLRVATERIEAPRALDLPNATQVRRDGVVLLVEDNAVNRMVARAMLEELGFQIVDAETGADALMLVSRQQFDLILMDCQMPVIDGFEASRRIRAQEQHAGAARRVPIIALTANAIAGDRERCLAAGMDDYLTKPFSQHKLLAAIACWLPADGDDVPFIKEMLRAG